MKANDTDIAIESAIGLWNETAGRLSRLEGQPNGPAEENAFIVKVSALTIAAVLILTAAGSLEDIIRVPKT